MRSRIALSSYLRLARLGPRHAPPSPPHCSSGLGEACPTSEGEESRQDIDKEPDIPKRYGQGCTLVHTTEKSTRQKAEFAYFLVPFYFRTTTVFVHDSHIQFSGGKSKGINYENILSKKIRKFN